MTAGFAEPLATFVAYTAVLDVIEAALQRMEMLLSMEPLPQQRPVASPETFDVRFDNVTFLYARGTQPALRDFDLILPQNGLVALVGASGSGKTTVAKLLQRHSDPQLGSISIGGIDLRRMEPDVLARCVSVVFQDVNLRRHRHGQYSPGAAECFGGRRQGRGD